jgi:hypothetical protein
VKGARDVLTLHHMAHTLIQPLADVIPPHMEATAAMHGVELFPIQMLLVRWRLDLGVDGRTVVQAARYTGAHLLALARMQSFLAERPDGAVWRALVAQDGVLPADGLARLGISLGEADWLYGPWLDPATARVELERRLHAMQRGKYRRLSVEDLLDSLSQVFLERTPSHDGVDTAARFFTTALSGDFIRTLEYRALDTIEALNVRTKGRARLKVARETPLTAREVEMLRWTPRARPRRTICPSSNSSGLRLRRRPARPHSRTTAQSLITTARLKAARVFCHTWPAPAMIPPLPRRSAGRGARYLIGARREERGVSEISRAGAAGALA